MSINVGNGKFFIVNRTWKTVAKCPKMGEVYFHLCYFNEANLSVSMDDQEIIERVEQFELRKYGSIS